MAQVLAFSKVVDDLVALHPSNSWLSNFKTPIDDHIADVLKDIDPDVLVFDPCDLEMLLESAANRLDICLSRRRDVLDLLDMAIRDALDRNLFSKLREIETRLEEASRLDSQLDALNGSAAAVASIQAGQDAAAAALIASAKGVEVSSKFAKDNDATRMTELKKKAKVLIEHNDNLITNAGARGHASNYFERAARVSTLLFDDVVEAYQKLCAARVGLREIWKEDHPLPKLDVGNIQGPQPRQIAGKNTQLGWEPQNILDALVLWSRKAARLLEKKRDLEIVADVQFPLWTPFALNGKDAASLVDIPIAQAISGANSGFVKFVLKASDFPGLVIESIKVLGISAAISVVDKDATPYNSRARLMIDLPSRPKELAYAGAPSRTVLLGSVPALDQGDPCPMTNATSILNASPLGEWGVRVLPGVNMTFASTTAPDRDWIKDVILQVRIAAQALPAAKAL